jgi:hypothetical protein
VEVMATPGDRSVAPARATRGPRGVPSAASVAEFIRGTTLLYPVLGSPITRVKAPMLCNAPFASMRLDVAVDAVLAAVH